MGTQVLEATAAAPKLDDEALDRALVAGVRAGDDAAFARLYDRYQRRILAYATGMTRDAARAEDIVQDVFVSALRRMRETERPIAFRPWVYEIAKNACIDDFRRARRAELVSIDAPDGAGAVAGRTLVAAAPTPEHAVEGKQRLADLRCAFGGLAPAQHEILVLREFEGLSYAEIGARMGLSRGAVESTLFRARRRLTEEYEELASGRRCVEVQALIDAAPAGELRIRRRGRLARHLGHCAGCRRHARDAGIDERVLEAPTVLERIAAFLPFPLLARRLSARWDATAGQAAALVPERAQAVVVAVAGLTVAGAGVGVGLGTHAGHGSPARALRHPAAAAARGHRSAAAASGVGGGVLRLGKRTALISAAQSAKSPPSGPAATALSHRAAPLVPGQISVVPLPRASAVTGRPVPAVPLPRGSANATGRSPSIPALPAPSVPGQPVSTLLPTGAPALPAPPAASPPIGVPAAPGLPLSAPPLAAPAGAPSALLGTLTGAVRAAAAGR